MEMMSNSKKLRIFPLGLTGLLVLLIVVPLAAIFLRMDGASLQKVFGSGQIWIVLGNSVLVSTLTTLIATGAAYLAAWCMTRTSVAGKRVFRVLILLPMLLPSISLGMGAVILGGNNGILTGLLGLDKSNIYGIWGILWGSVTYSLPVAFLMIENILQFEDSLPYEAAAVMGLTGWQQFKAITFPYLRKPMCAVLFSIFTLSFTDYGVPLMVGGKFKTLAAVMYQEVIGQLDFGAGCVYGTILLVPAVAAFLVDMANKNSSTSSFVTKPFVLRKRRAADALSTLATGAISIFCLLPILAFVVLAFVKRYPTDYSFTFENFQNTFRLSGGKYLLNSVIIALLVACFGVIIGTLSAYFTARSNHRSSRWLHLIAMSTGAIPGVVLGLAYVLLFKGSFLQGTLVLLIMVNTVHFFSSPYLMMHTSFSKVNQNLEVVAATLGVGKKRLFLDVLLPKCKHTVMEMFSYYFVNCMMTISAVSFLATTGNKPIALMINQFEAQAQLEEAAVVSLLILIVNLIMKSLLERKDAK